jgi:O-methyltransferase
MGMSTTRRGRKLLNLSTLLGTALRRFGLTTRSYEERFPDFPPEVIATVSAVAPYTMTTPERIEAVIRAVEYIVKANIPGAFVECGVWKGGSMMAVAETLLRLGQSDRELYLFDTFQGMATPSERDRDHRGEPAAGALAREPRTSTLWAVAPIEEVRLNMERTGYPMQRVTFVPGLVEETIPREAPQRIALLRLDTDWYKSTRHEMEHLFPHLSSGGVLIVDDYGHWSGARQAIDEYLNDHDVPLLLCRIDYTGRIAVKSPPLDR